MIPFTELVNGDLFYLWEKYTGGTPFLFLKLDNRKVFQVHEGWINGIKKPGALCRHIGNISNLVNVL